MGPVIQQLARSVVSLWTTSDVPDFSDGSPTGTLKTTKFTEVEAGGKILELGGNLLSLSQCFSCEIP